MVTFMNTLVLTPEQVIQKLHWRYATANFASNKKIPEDVWHALEQSLVLAPSCYGLQPWKFVVVRNQALRHQLVKHAFNQAKIVESSHLVVLAIKTNINVSDVAPYIDRVAQVRQVPVSKLEKFSDAIKNYLTSPPFPLQPDKWSAKQVYLALGFFLYSAAMLGIDTCPIEGFVPSQFDDVLGLSEQGYSAVVLCTAGYRSENDRSAALPKVRYETEKVVQYID
ncbi:MAG: NAD(P)H-dependent oxidoreductase [Cyanobacteria bacterium P01_F01_bin.53]